MVRPEATSNSTRGDINGGLGYWSSPVPYLLGGFCLLMGLITMALLILSCSYRRTSPNSAAEGEEKSGHKMQVEMLMEMEPKIVVIMAGDNNPSYLAKPVSCSYHCQLTEQV